MRDLTTTTGVGAIPTILDLTLIDLLRTRMVLEAAGATILADLDGGLFAIPRQSAASTFQWVAEGAAPSGSNQTIDQVAFSPKTASAWTNYTRRFLEVANQKAEPFVRQDLMKVVARGLDAAGFFGTGASNQPTGIANTSGVATVSLGTNGGVPTYNALVSMETQVAIANADFGALAYITNAQGRSTMKQTLKVSASTFPIYLWDVLAPVDGVPKGLVNGYEAWVSNQLPSNLTKGTGTALSPAFFGNFEDLIFALWGGMDTIVDPYSGSTTGSVKIVVLQDADINVRHPQSFSIIVDMITQ
jgi:HK97 family phage major capsid protein